MSYISRSTRELRGNNRQRQGAKAGGKDMGQRPGGRELAVIGLSSLSSDYRSLISLCRIRSHDLGA